MIFIGKFLTVFGCLVSLTGSAYGASTLSGSVTGPDGLAISGALVEVVEVEGRTWTDGLGQYSFGNIPPGSYKLLVTADDFEPVETAVTVTKDEITTAPIQITEIKRRVASVEVVGEAADTLSEIPGSVFMITSAELNNSTPVDANEILRKVPGLVPRVDSGPVGLRTVGNPGGEQLAGQVLPRPALDIAANSQRRVGDVVPVLPRRQVDVDQETWLVLDVDEGAESRATTEDQVVLLAGAGEAAGDAAVEGADQQGSLAANRAAQGSSHPTDQVGSTTVGALEPQFVFTHRRRQSLATIEIPARLGAVGVPLPVRVLEIVTHLLDLQSRARDEWLGELDPAGRLCGLWNRHADGQKKSNQGGGDGDELGADHGTNRCLVWLWRS